MQLNPFATKRIRASDVSARVRDTCTQIELSSIITMSRYNNRLFPIILAADANNYSNYYNVNNDDEEVMLINTTTESVF